MLIFPSMYQSTIFGTSVRPRAPPKAVPPGAPGNQLEWACADFLTSTGDADDDGFTPAAVAALEGLAHQIDIAHALEAIVGAAIGATDQIGHQITLHFFGIDEVRHAEFFSQRTATWVEVHADDLVGADRAGTLDNIQTDAPQAEYDNIGARFNFGGVDDGANTGCDATADVAHLVKGCIGADLRDGNFGSTV